MHFADATLLQATAGFFISEVIVRLSIAIAKRASGGTLQYFAVMLA